MWKVLSGIETLNPVILSAESLELMERKYALRPYKVESILDVESVTRVARTKTYILILEYKHTYHAPGTLLKRREMVERCYMHTITSHDSTGTADSPVNWGPYTNVPSHIALANL